MEECSPEAKKLKFMGDQLWSKCIAAVSAANAAKSVVAAIMTEGKDGNSDDEDKSVKATTGALEKLRKAFEVQEQASKHM